jgi:hypothetical protein
MAKLSKKSRHPEEPVRPPANPRVASPLEAADQRLRLFRFFLASESVPAMADMFPSVSVRPEATF